MPARKPIVIVPTYNEAGNIVRLIESIRSSVPTLDILVVDDGSPDGTGALVQTAAQSDPTVHLLARTQKQGLGAAYIAGFDWALARGYDFLIQIDADFSHPIEALSRFLTQAEHSAVVVGSRYMRGGSVSGWGLLRKIISRGGNIYARTVLRVPTKDMTGGFNGWWKESLQAVDYSSIRSRGYVFQVEMKYRAWLAGLTVTEVPIHFENRTVGESKMSGAIFWEAALQVLLLRKGSRRLLLST